MTPSFTTSNFEWEKMKKLRKVDTKKLGRLEGEQSAWGIGHRAEGRRGKVRR